MAVEGLCIFALALLREESGAYLGAASGRSSPWLQFPVHNMNRPALSFQRRGEANDL